jgi:outer membrane protein TolC
MNPRQFRIRLIPFVILATGIALLSVGTFAQQGAPDASSLPRAQQVTPSGRAQSGGDVQAAQSSEGNGGTSSINTVNSTIQVTGPYQGSIPDPHAPHGPLTLNIADAIGRGLRFNLGSVSANSSVKQLRGERLAALSQLLPNIYATLTESGAKIDLETQGLSAGTFGSVALPTTVGPYHYYSALANITENASITGLHNLRQAQASADAAQMSAEDARELITLAVGGTYLQILATKANVASQEAQVKQAQVTFRQSDNQYLAGTKPVIDRNRNFVEFHTQEQRLTSLRGDLLKQTMQLDRLIGLPVSQVLTLSEDLPAHVAEALSVEDAVKLALADRSDLKAARLQWKAASEAHRASKAEYLPALGVTGDYGLEGVNPNKGVTVFQASGTITIPIFQSGRVRADVEQADAALDQRRAEYADEQGVVELDVRQAYVDFQVATEQIAVAQENRRVAAETLTRVARPLRRRCCRFGGSRAVAGNRRLGRAGLCQQPLLSESFPDQPCPGDGTSRKIHSKHAERKLTMPTEELKDQATPAPAEQKPGEPEKKPECDKPEGAEAGKKDAGKKDDAGNKDDASKKDETEKKKPLDPATKRRRIIIGVVVGVVVLAVGVAWWLYSRTYESTDDAQINGHLNAIASRVSGTVEGVYVENGQPVKAGQSLVDLDPSDYEVLVAQARANYEQAIAQAAAETPNVPITVTSNRATVDVGCAAGRYQRRRGSNQRPTRLRQQCRKAAIRPRRITRKAQSDLVRYKKLVDQGEISLSDYDQYVASAGAEA